MATETPTNTCCLIKNKTKLHKGKGMSQINRNSIGVNVDNSLKVRCVCFPEERDSLCLSLSSAELWNKQYSQEEFPHKAH